jgi:Ni/Co efflux regulator RcnB
MRQQQQSSEQSRGNWDRSRFNGQANAVQQQVVVQQQVERSRRNYDGQAQQWQRRGESTDQQTQQWQRRQVTDGQRSWQQSGQTWQQRQGTDGQRSWQRSGQQWTQNSARYAGNWSRDWRNDRRYDWRRYRDSHRSIFHIGVYFDPFGYGYQPFNIGYRLQPYYYGQQYWIDPAMYNLPYPPPGTMWVRYWNDALLVDTYSGEVVDVIRDFFW